MIILILLKAVFHSIMLIPIIVTGDYNKYKIFNFSFKLATNVWKRHHLLEETIGHLPVEQQSYEAITTLFYTAVVLIPVLTILELTLYLLYQCKVSDSN